ncbi:hypothetical protein ON010_g10384 [Phytophthora cinnamomi]|nr:hypothetical protein ON010_g10384 [Phytophthora cinnamomi]
MDSTSIPWSVMPPQQLPIELVEVLCGYFTGFDAFSLSVTNAWWRNYLSDESFWKKCLRGLRTRENHPSGTQSWKKQYVQSRSMLFEAPKSNGSSKLLDSFMYLTNGENKQRLGRFQLTHMGGESFSFDLWFSLLSESREERFGGIIYGLQSSSRESCEWPHFYHQFVMVTSTGDLCCSVLDEKPVVARRLKPNRWYHVALTYDHPAQLQDVYFNGLKVQSKTGLWRYQWHFMTYAQVGTGFDASDALNGPGWRGFHGVIDAFRVWGAVLSQDEVTKLERGGLLGNERLKSSLVQEGSDNDAGHARLVKCTRPTESETLQLALIKRFSY